MPRGKKPIVINTKGRDWVQIKQGKSTTLIPVAVLTTVGLGMFLFGILYMLGVNPLHDSKSVWGLLFAGTMFVASGFILGRVLAGTPFSASGFTSALLHLVSRRLIPEDQLYERLNADYTTLNRAMRQNDVQPRLIINGARYYSHGDFGDIATLLRASSASSTSQEVLLRPAAAGTETPQVQLLRAADQSAEEASTQQPAGLELSPALQNVTPASVAPHPEQVVVNRKSGL
ncbi:MAG TPA: hypothetical protein VKU00_23180 [Chthonomonadaceae bacterium]|nr:hypothetical protein [Chthonomonadaceae bacterium]